MKILSIILLLVFSLPALARFDVSFSVQATGNNELKETVESYVARELRSLGDVDIVKSRTGFYDIFFMVSENRLTDNRLTGYSIIMVINWKAQCISGETKYDCYVFDDLITMRGAPEDLRKICEQLITDFDTVSLKTLRKEK